MDWNCVFLPSQVCGFSHLEIRFCKHFLHSTCSLDYTESYQMNQKSRLNEICSSEYFHHKKDLNLGKKIFPSLCLFAGIHKPKGQKLWCWFLILKLAFISVAVSTALRIKYGSLFYLSGNIPIAGKQNPRTIFWNFSMLPPNDSTLYILSDVVQHNECNRKKNGCRIYQQENAVDK